MLTTKTPYFLYRTKTGEKQKTTIMHVALQQRDDKHRFHANTCNFRFHLVIKANVCIVGKPK